MMFLMSNFPGQGDLYQIEVVGFQESTSFQRGARHSIRGGIFVVHFTSSISNMMVADEFQGNNLWSIFSKYARSCLLSKMECLEPLHDCQAIEGGVKISYGTLFRGVSEAMSVQYIFFFPDSLEERRYYCLISPEQPQAVCHFRVSILDDLNKYFNVIVLDNNGLMLAADSIVFNRSGELFPFTRIPQNRSARRLEHAWLEELTMVAGYDFRHGHLPPRRLLRYTTVFTSTSESFKVVHAWQNSGMTRTFELLITPERLVAVSEFPLDDPSVAPTCWMVCAVDDLGKFVAQAFFEINSLMCTMGAYNHAR